jgi:hypothetical protein
MALLYASHSLRLVLARYAAEGSPTLVWRPCSHRETDGDFAFCIWAHDERQIATKPELVRSSPSHRSERTEEFFTFRVPPDCEWKSEINWKETH